MIEMKEVEVVDEVNETEEVVEEEFVGDKRKKVATKCPRCPSTTAYLCASRSGGGSLVSSGSMNMVQYECVSCKFVWSLGY